MASFTIEAVFKATGADSFSNSFKEATADVENMDTSAQNSTDGIKGMVGRMAEFAGAIGITKAVSAGFGMVKNSVGDAVARFDTLSNANKVFENMGFGAEETARTIDSMKKSLDGLPTSAEDAIGNIQRISMANNDIESAGSLFENLNYAVLATGKSQEEVNGTVEMFSRALQRGTMNGHEWETLMRNMGPTMNTMAEMMGVSTETLQQGLSDGSISLEDFEVALGELATNGHADFASLEKQARDMTDGIGTAMTNMGGRITQGIESGIIKPLDEALANNSLPTLGQMINNFSGGVRDSFASLASPVTNAVNSLVGFGDHVSSKLGNLDTSGIDKLASAVLPAISSGFETMMSIVQPALDGLIEAFGNLWDSVQPIVSAVAEALTPAFDILGSLLGGIVKGAIMRLSAAFNILSTVFTFLTPVVDLLVATLKMIAPALQFIAEWVGVAMGFFGDFGEAGMNLKTLLETAFENIKEIVQTAVEFIDNAIGVGRSIFSSLKDAGVALKEGLSDAWTAIVDKIQSIEDPINSAIEAVKGVFSSLKDAGDRLRNGLSTAWNFITTKIQGAKDAISSAISGIRGFFSGLGGAGSSLSSRLSGAWSSITGAVSGAYGSISGYIDQIKGLFTSLGDIDLFSAGKAILDGFLRGLKAPWKATKKFVSGIGTWIKDNKGPISYDRRLLIPAGGAIMSGLNEGLQRSFKDVQRNVSGMADAISRSLDTSLSVDSVGLDHPRIDEGHIGGIYGSRGEVVINQYITSPEPMNEKEMQRQSRIEMQRMGGKLLGV